MYDPGEVPGPVHGDWSRDDSAPRAFRYATMRNGYDVIPETVYRAAKAAYFGLITQIDYNIGRVFGALQDEHIYDETLVLFTSDHGEYLGDHGTAAKSFLHDVSARVPMILRLPKSADSDVAGVVVESVVSHCDILVTLATAAGASAPSQTDGQDLVALARGVLEHPREYVVGATGISFMTRLGFPPSLSITDGRHKYIWYPEGGVEQFFDLDVDPKELSDLSKSMDHGEERQRMATLLVEDLRERAPQWLDKGELPLFDVGDEPDPSIRRQGWLGFQGEHAPGDTRH